ncbi:MAG TPA: YHS domain-containing protein [Ktedonobacterales bacterium]|nr:YHS domain-containing protein [Ktedonobacterales bacterium]
METHETRDDQATMATDPVCGMEVDPAAAAATSEYRGKTYYFCAVGCKKRFDNDPQSYISAQEP